MKIRILTAVFFASFLATTQRVSAQGTAFIYHGQLTQSGVPVNGTRDLRFGLYDAGTDGNQVATQSVAGVLILLGNFNVTLDFGPGLLNGSSRWLEISVKNTAGQYTALKPRQKFMPTPYAIMANTASNLLGTLPASQLSGTIPAARISGTYSQPMSLNNSANQFAGNGAGLVGVDALTLNGLSAASFWNLNGNASTQPGVNFLGTTDDQALEVKVNNGRAFRFEPNVDSTANLIGGAADNYVLPGKVGATISGGGESSSGETNFVASHFGSIGGGAGNRIGEIFDSYATIAGGRGNEIFGLSWFGVDFGANSTIGGGSYNTVLASESVIAGGLENRIGPAQIGSSRGGTKHTIGGGAWNMINYDNFGSTVAGGVGNFIDASYASIAGGISNTVGWIGSSAGNAIGGGQRNLMRSVASSTIAGGADNQINNGGWSTITGGKMNSITGQYGTIAGGYSNTVTGNYSFAAGVQAKALHAGDFVWADNSGLEFPSTSANQFSVRSVGGARFVTAIDGSGTPTAGVELPAGGGAWSTLSDRNSKENLAPINSRDVLERVSQMHIATWNYKTQEPSVRHIGPMAQDFAKAFQVGESEKRITTVDADGVALAAIQGLHEIVKEKDSEIQQLKARLEKLEQLMNQKAEARQ